MFRLLSRSLNLKLQPGSLTCLPFRTSNVYQQSFHTKCNLQCVLCLCMYTFVCGRRCHLRFEFLGGGCVHGRNTSVTSYVQLPGNTCCMLSPSLLDQRN